MGSNSLRRARARILAASSLFTIYSSGTQVVAQGTVAGTVQDATTGRPIVAAEVLMESVGAKTATDSRGRFSLSDIPAGRLALAVRFVGYRPALLVVEVVPGKTTVRTVKLAPEPVRLDSVVVTAPAPKQPRGSGLEGLEERQRRGFGRFLTGPELRQLDDRDMITVLRRLGVEVRRQQAVGRTGCPLVIYLDGVRIREPPRLSTLTVSGFAAIEVYAGVAQIPPEFDGLDQTCGLLVLWTRRGP